jgi:hypothetical protein
MIAATTATMIAPIARHQYRLMPVASISAALGLVEPEPRRESGDHPVLARDRRLLVRRQPAQLAAQAVAGDPQLATARDLKIESGVDRV